jgi:hypothetical protein
VNLKGHCFESVEENKTDARAAISDFLKILYGRLAKMETLLESY